MIFDLGFHNGNDTEYYLKKGFEVIAVEANPILVINGITKFKEYIDNKKLIIVNKAVCKKIGRVDFHLHPTQLDWSSCDKNLAERDGSNSNPISIRTTTLLYLCKEYGVPYYLKVDIEGQELFVAEELSIINPKPKFVSFETGRSNYSEIIIKLFIAGYRKFQLRNQLNNNEYTSGDFGKYLPIDKWLNCSEVLFRYGMYAELKNLDDKELALGLLDVHAKL